MIVYIENFLQLMIKYTWVFNVISKQVAMYILSLTREFSTVSYVWTDGADFKLKLSQTKAPPDAEN